jgi:hypothetical protein
MVEPMFPEGVWRVLTGCVALIMLVCLAMMAKSKRTGGLFSIAVAFLTAWWIYLGIEDPEYRYYQTIVEMRQLVQVVCWALAALFGTLAAVSKKELDLKLKKLKRGELSLLVLGLFLGVGWLLFFYLMPELSTGWLFDLARRQAGA